jgi:hypothetical protein
VIKRSQISWDERAGALHPTLTILRADLGRVLHSGRSRPRNGAATWVSPAFSCTTLRLFFGPRIAAITLIVWKRRAICADNTFMKVLQKAVEMRIA